MPAAVMERIGHVGRSLLLGIILMIFSQPVAVSPSPRGMLPTGLNKNAQVKI
jgi:hypothetical protein